MRGDKPLQSSCKEINPYSRDLPYTYRGDKPFSTKMNPSIDWTLLLTSTQKIRAWASFRAKFPLFHPVSPCFTLFRPASPCFTLFYSVILCQNCPKVSASITKFCQRSAQVILKSFLSCPQVVLKM